MAKVEEIVDPISVDTNKAVGGGCAIGVAIGKGIVKMMILRLRIFHY